MRILSCLTVAILSVVSPICLAEQTTSTTSSELINEIKDESSGFGRTRYGMLFSLGYGQGQTDGDQKKDGLDFSVGAQATFTPIRNWLEIEAGLIATYGLAMGENQKDGQTPTSSPDYKYNLSTGQVYAGLIFPIGSSGAALSAGAFTSLYNKPQLSSDVKEKIIKYKLHNIEDDDFENHIGLYTEYQFSSDKDSTIFVRLNGGQYDRVENGANGKTFNEQYFTLTFGFKANGSN